MKLLSRKIVAFTTEHGKETQKGDKKNGEKGPYMSSQEYRKNLI